MNAGPTLGYAAVLNDVVDMRTVGPHARSAMVNWLYLTNHGGMVGWSDSRIRQAFARDQAIKAAFGVKLELAVISGVVQRVVNPHLADMTAMPTEQEDAD